jgi:hypothetical protein
VVNRLDERLLNVEKMIAQVSDVSCNSVPVWFKMTIYSYICPCSYMDSSKTERNCM